MKYTTDDIRDMRFDARIIAVGVLTSHSKNRELSTDVYEIDALAESILQTYIMAGLSPTDVTTAATPYQNFLNKQTTLQQ